MPAQADDETTITGTITSGIGSMADAVVDTLPDDIVEDEPIAELEGAGTFSTWGSDLNVRSQPTTESGIVTTLTGPTSIEVACQTEGELVSESGYSNDWWSYVPDLGGYVSNIYIDTPESVLPGIEDCGTDVDLLSDDLGDAGAGTPSGIEYVALGDSYAAGVGGGNYYGVPGCQDPDALVCTYEPPVPGSDVHLMDADDGCHKSTHAYPVQLAERLDARLSFAACYGAVISDVEKQLDDAYMSGSVSTADVVTIQVGGNDAGFQRVLRACGDPRNDATACTAAINEARRVIEHELPGRLAGLYAQVKEYASAARVVVVGYPKLFTAEPGWTNPGDCVAVTDFSQTEQVSLNDTAELMNSAIGRVAESHGFAYVDVLETFGDHATCSDDPWFHAYSIEYMDDLWWEAFHPTPAGHAAYADLIDDYLAG